MATWQFGAEPEHARHLHFFPMASTATSSTLTVAAHDPEKAVLSEKGVNDDTGEPIQGPRRKLFKLKCSNNTGAPTPSERPRRKLFKWNRKKSCNNTVPNAQRLPSVPEEETQTRKRFHPKDILTVLFMPVVFLARCCCFFCMSPRYRYPPGVRKPIIYIFSPTEIDVHVGVSLSSELAFSAIYPVVPVETRNRMEKIHWNIRTHLDGSLTENTTGLDVSYLFWEAEINKAAPLSPPPSPILEQPNALEYFSPASCSLSDSNSVVVPTSKVSVYLDKTLRALGLHTEARTSFITFWLPYLEKYEYIALRFIPQSAYERAAPMEISPVPDVVTRVFMLFRGVTAKSATREWPKAVACVEKDVEWWRDVVGVDLERALDPGLFRVLEWGGLEVAG